MSTEWTTQQQDAIEKVRDWYHNSGEQVFRLFGFAGTGKTTLANSTVDQLDLSGRALYGAFTGKAAHVLRSKGGDGASTIHSLIYTPKQKAREKLEELYKQRDRETDPQERSVLERAIRVEEEKLAKPAFVLKEDSEVAGAPLVVLDEVSMIGSSMAADLLSFGTKLLVLGDPAQLPPVDGDGYFINHTPDHLLTEIHRSALDSPVTRLATAVRNSPPGDRALGLPGLDGDSGRTDQLNPGELLEFDQVIVGTNRIRWNFNTALRALRGRTGPIPQKGDRVICLANNPDNEVFNGQQLVVEDCAPNSDYEDVLHLEAVDDEDRYRELNVWACGFVDADGEKEAKRSGRGRVAAATWAEAITCHKSQGSQWDNVLVYDESQVFGRMAYKDNVDRFGRDTASMEAHAQARKWLYTAVTRAAKRVVVLGGGR